MPQPCVNGSFAETLGGAPIIISRQQRYQRMSSTFSQLRRHVRQNGLRKTAARCWAELRSFLFVCRAAWTRPRFATDGVMLDVVFGSLGFFIRPAQIREEIEPLLRLVRDRQPRTILEIGTHRGGTLFLWSRVAAEEAEIISLDLPGGEFGGGYACWKRPLYRAFALPKQCIHLLQGDSHDPTSLAKVRALLNLRPLDFLLIDGDHTYEGVKKDFEMYGPLVRPGGLIAFHDIAEHVDRSCQVRTFWLELAQRQSTQEFIASPPAGWAGIGVLEPGVQVESACPAART